MTPRGWLAVGAGAVALVAARLLGSPELYVFGSAALLLVLGVFVSTRLLSQGRLEVERTLHPPRVHAGTSCRVDLAIRNLGPGRTPVLVVRDEVSGTQGAMMRLPPLAPGGVARGAYRLPTDHRGVLTVGPLQARRSDPFGLLHTDQRAAAATRVIVYPAVDDIAPVPLTTGNDPLAGAEHPNALGRDGDDLYALRPYVVGDDLRRVHWPSTARHDELMVRQEELSWQGRATVLLDVRRAAHDDASLERAVSAAASVVAASGRRQDLVRLVDADGWDSGVAPGRAHVDAVLEHLAVVAPSRQRGLGTALERLAVPPVGGALVAVVAHPAPDELDALVRVGSRYGSLTVVQVSTGASVALPRRRGCDLVVVGEEGFAAAWSRLVPPRATPGAGRTGVPAGRAGVGR